MTMTDCIYWSYPNWFRTFVNKVFPSKDTWNITAWKTERGDYAFNQPPFIWNEALVGGTETCIDFHHIYKYGSPCGIGERVKITVSCKPIHTHTTICKWESSDGEGGNWYRDTVSNMPMWLCGVNQVMFGHVPDRIWVYITKA
jgi:hypothetical protein